ncbi:hypothetical protein Avbf_11245 [Armadillidium vulgare]|nr:hypothetical protein Avbf_11245 [Armadillidium vulgare]
MLWSISLRKVQWLYFLAKRKDIDSMFFNIVIIILIILIIMVKPTKAANVSKKQKTSVADITHELLERLKSNMDRYTYTVRVRDADFFNGQRGIEDSFQMVMHEVIDTVLRDLEYDSSCMRVGINFTFNDGAPRSQQYFVNIRWRDVAAVKCCTGNDEAFRRIFPIRR